MEFLERAFLQYGGPIVAEHRIITLPQLRDQALILRTYRETLVKAAQTVLAEVSPRIQA